MWNQRNRYFSTKKVISQGKSYDSKFEAQYGMLLEDKLKKGEIAGFDTHYRIPLIVNGYTICNYYVDFAIYHLDETTEYCETKGWMSDVFRIKWKLFCALFEDDPNIKITLEMQGKFNPPKLRKTKK
jgi:hypothetical protein